MCKTTDKKYLAFVANVREGTSEAIELDSIPAGRPVNSEQLAKLISSQRLDATCTEYGRKLNVSKIGDVSVSAESIPFSGLSQKEQTMILGMYNLGCRIPSGLIRGYEERLLPRGYSGNPLPENKHPDENDEMLESFQSGLMKEKAKYLHEQRRSRTSGSIIYVLNKDDESLVRKPL